MLLTLLFAGFLPLAGAQRAAGDDGGDRDIDDLWLGTQLGGQRVSHYDFEGRIVVCYHWCITCPISTGMFPRMNRLREEYADDGVMVIGFQVRRTPEVLENNVVWNLQHLKPNFPVARLGKNWAWPAEYLPWALVFDHRGQLIYAGNVPGIEGVIEKALAKAPDFLVGGPHDLLTRAASEIATDRAHAGRYLPALREIAAAEGGDASKAAEARAMLDNVEAYFLRQVAKAEEESSGVAEEVSIYRQLAAMFDGDGLGDRARKRIEERESGLGFAGEVEASLALAGARRALRRLPPAGGYAYDMTYTETDDETVLALRSHLVAELHLEMKRIIREHPTTTAALDAVDLAAEHPMPVLDAGQARNRLGLARRLLEKAKRPYEFFDGYLVLFEVLEGYAEDDELAGEAAFLKARIELYEAKKLSAAGEAFRALNAEADRILGIVDAGGSTLPRKEADGHIRRLRTIARDAGAASRLALRLQGEIAELERSYEGAAKLGVAFDTRFEGAGARILYVHPGSSALAHGLERGDVIVEFDGRKIASHGELGQAIKSCKPGEAVDVVIQRTSAGGDGAVATKTRKVVLGSGE